MLLSKLDVFFIFSPQLLSKSKTSQTHLPDTMRTQPSDQAVGERRLDIWATKPTTSLISLKPANRKDCTMSDQNSTAARRQALGLSVVSGGRDAPAEKAAAPAKVTVAAVDGDTEALDVKASTFVKWLEEQYHQERKYRPLADVSVMVTDLPEPEVVERAEAMMKARGWYISVIEHKSAGCRAGSVDLVPPGR